MSTLTRYLVPCLTENINVTSDYRTSPITVCPNNNTHVINQEGIVILDTKSPKTVTINQNSQVMTGQHYLADFFELQVPGGTGSTGTYDIKYDYNVSAYSITFLVTMDNIGDNFEVISLPNTYIGATTQDLEVGSNNLTINSLVGLNPGFNLSISNGTTTNDLGYIISLDPTTNSITFSKSNIDTFESGADIYFSIPRIKNGKFVNTQNFGLGYSTLGSSGLPAGKVVRLNYINNSTESKILTFYVELQF